MVNLEGIVAEAKQIVWKVIGTIDDAISDVFSAPRTVGRSLNMALLGGALALWPAYAGCGPRECGPMERGDEVAGCDGHSDVCSSQGYCVDAIENPQEACGDSPLKGKLYINLGDFGGWNLPQMLYFRQRDCYLAIVDFQGGSSGSNWNTGYPESTRPQVPTRSVLEQETPSALDEEILQTGGSIEPYGYNSSNREGVYIICATFLFGRGNSPQSTRLSEFYNFLMQTYGGLVAGDLPNRGVAQNSFDETGRIGYDDWGATPYIEIEETMNVRELVESAVAIALSSDYYRCLVEVSNGRPNLFSLSCDEH